MGGKPFATRGISFSSRKAPEGERLIFSRSLRIPFARSCVITLFPPENKTIPHAQTQVICGLFNDNRFPPPGRMERCVVHSLEHYKVRGTGTPVELLDLEGKGLLHSLHLALCNPDTGGQFMEGNIEIYVDGESRSSYASSGTEEFFFGGIYFINPFWTPDAGCTLSIHEPGNPERRTSAYRIFRRDPITFDRRIRILWYNGQKGQGEVDGTTVVDSQSVVYLQRKDENVVRRAEPDISCLIQRLNLLDGDPESGPMQSSTVHFSSVHPDEAVTLCDLQGAGYLYRLQLNLPEPTERSTRARIMITRDGEKICDEEIAALFGTYGICRDFAADVVGQTVTQSGRLHLQRELFIPYNQALNVQLISQEASGTLEGFAVTEQRVSRSGLPSDFGRYQVPLIRAGRCKATGEGKTHNLIDVGSVHEGVVKEISLSISSFPEDSAIPPKLFLECDGEIRAVWFPQTFVPGLGDVDTENHVLPGNFSIRDGKKWAAFVDLRETPFTFLKSARLFFNTAGLPEGTEVKALMSISRSEKKPFRKSDLQEIEERLNALDGGVLSGRAICRTVLEDGDIDPGMSKTLLDLPGAGSLQWIRVGTPGSARALRRSTIRIRVSDLLTSPSIDTQVQNIFATWFDPFPFWENAGDTVRPTQLHRQKGGEHSSAYRFFNFPFSGRCKIELMAPSDDNGAMRWLESAMPGKSPRDVIKGDVEIPEHIREGLLRCADVGLFVQVYANQNKYTLPAGRKTFPYCIARESADSTPGEPLILADINGKGILTALQPGMENDVSEKFKESSLMIYIDGERMPSWSVPDIGSFFLGTPEPGSGEGTQLWEDASTRGRNAPGAGNRLLSPQAGTTIFTSSPPFQLGGYRFFDQDAITFEHSLRVECHLPASLHSTTSLWSLAVVAVDE